jgi:transporter family-2 protein
VNFILYIFAASAGAINAIQAGANSQLRKSLDQPLLAGMTVYLTALIALSFALPFAHLGSFQWSKLQAVPWWAWLGGLLSIGSTMTGVMLAQKLGSAVFTALTVTFSLLCSVVLDNFGWVGFQPHPANFPRLAGCALLLGGLVLVTRF